jgi:hypothetical protein
MIPKFLQPKNDIKNDSELVPIAKPKIEEKVECANCFKKYPIEKGFIVLRAKSNKFEHVCSVCATLRFDKLIYIEDHKTFAKRLKAGFFDDWKVKYEKN